jgi:hypothetical protein
MQESDGFLNPEWLVAVFTNGNVDWTSEWMGREVFEEKFLKNGRLRNLQHGDRKVNVYTRIATDVTDEVSNHF